jgi:hypothetical protein
MHRTIDSGRVRDGVLTGAIVAAQALTSLYYGIFFGLYLAVVFLVLLLQQRAVLAAALILPYTIPYFANRNVVGVRKIDEVMRYSALPRNYLAAPAQNLVYGWTAGRFGQPERWLFPGITVLLLAIAAIRSPARWQVVAYTVGLVFAFDASLGLNGIFYSSAHHALPVLHGLRAPARFGILVCLSLAVLAGYGAAALLRSGNAARQRRLLVAGASVLILAEYATTVQLFTVPQIPSVYAWLRREPRSVVAELPVPRADNLSVIHDGLFMYFSTTHWQPLLNGYSGFYPPSYLDLIETLRGFPDDPSIDILRQRGVDYLIVHGRFYTPDEFGAVIAALETRHDVTPVGRFAAPGGESRVYRLRGTSSAIPAGREQNKAVTGPARAFPTGS